jgi:hemerythrin-like metal-binding protein
MARFEWGKFLSVHDEMIDADHQGLFKLVDRLSDPIERRKRPVIAKAVDEAAQYAMAHFAREEELMRDIGYPLLSQHRAIHRQLEEKIRSWKTRIEENWQPWHGGAFFVVMSHWLVHHIINEDQLIAQFIQDGTVDRARLALRTVTH